MAHGNASPLFFLAASLLLGCDDRSSRAGLPLASSGPAIHFVSGDAEVTRTFLPDEVHVRLTGFPAHGRVTLRASMPGYASHATLRADADGAVDLATQAPDGGTYEGADGAGLFWSMVATGAPRQDLDDDIDVTVRAELGGRVVATATLARDTAAPGVVETEVHDKGLDAVLVTPATPGPHPALLTFGGSEGGISYGRMAARLYASLGYTCLGLAYFGAQGLPPNLDDLPIEYFGGALSWMKQRPEVKADSIGVLGVSRGGELALLLGATYPELRAVVAGVPSGVIWPGWDPDRPSVEIGSWTYGGHELPYVHANGAQPVYTTDAEGRTVERDSPMFLAALDASSASALDAATTRVERTKGPVLLLASADDQLWPSCRLAGIAMDRLTAHGHTTAFADDLVCYPSAGHRLGTPGLPTTDLSTEDSGDGLRIALGGTPAGIARAARDAYERKRAFLAAALE